MIDDDDDDDIADHLKAVGRLEDFSDFPPSIFGLIYYFWPMTYL
jgi:hypothetical protein